MPVNEWLQILFLAAVLTGSRLCSAATWRAVYQGERSRAHGVLGPLEPVMYRLLQTDPADEQDWKGYARAMVLFSAGSWFVLDLVLRTQGLPLLNPRGFTHSQAQNNGSAFAGYSGFVQPVPGNLGSHGLTFADISGGWVMMLGRFVPILAVLALAGALGPRRIAPAGLGTLRTDTATFAIFLVGFILIFAVLTFLTVLVIAPFAQALSSHLIA